MLLSLVPSLVPGAAARAGEPAARVVVDQAGRKVTLTRPVKRIVSSFKPATLDLFALGLGDRLVGVDLTSRQDPLHRALWPGIAELPNIADASRVLNLETVVGLKPDLVVLFAQAEGARTADRLTSLGIPTVVILPESLALVERSLQVIAAAVGEPERATRVVGIMHEALDLAAARVPPPGSPGRPRVYYASPRGLLSTVSGRMMQDELIARAGGVNVAHGLTGYFPLVSPEQVMAWNPQVVVVSAYLRVDWRQELRAGVWPQTAAVRAGRVVQFPSPLAPWDFPSPLAALGALWLAGQLHPAALAGLDLPARLADLHRRLFGRSPAELTAHAPAGSGEDGRP
ncbi:MAG: ABC transporter substrate-binding protein [Deltaproteobacteria bacterium]|nr:ABC transporter substrate-binding protein [Deltaproteobacteria bacterium]